jgi:hypothetical protein
MATTRLADVIYGPLFVPTVINRINQLSVIRNSGLASTGDAEIQAFANGPGDIIQMPFWNDISGDSNISTDDPAQVAIPNKITQGQDMARKIRRNNGWQSANLVAAVLTEDPLDIIAQLIADYWVREEQKILGFVMNGVFADPLMAGHVLAVASESGATTPVLLDAEVAANAFALLGDQGMQLTAFMMHSRVFWNLVASSAVTYDVDPATGAPLLQTARWMGRRVLIDDSMPRVAGTTSGFKYTTYMFAAGAIAYAEAQGAGGPKKPVAIEAKEDAGNGEGIETVWYRRHWVMHPRGVRFDGTVAGNSVSNAELASGANWTRVYDAKNIRMVAVVTNG